MRRLAVLVLFAATVARADDGDEPPPAPVRVQIALAGVTAHLTARVDLDVTGPDLEDSALVVRVPRGAVVTTATASLDGATHPLALVAHDDATNAFEQLAKARPGPDRGWGIELHGGGGGSVEIAVASPHAAHLELALELEAPTCFYRDRRYVLLAPGWRDALDVDVAARVVDHDEALNAACRGADDAEWLGFATDELAARPAGERRIEARAAGLTLGSSQLAKVELALAHHLGDVPADLHTVLLVDGSRSLTADEASAQRAIALAYLRAAPRSQVQVIAYARTPRALLPGWQRADGATLAIGRALRALPPRNGSNLDAGLAAAASWLARVHGTRRVIVVTDERVPDRLARMEPAELARALPPDTLVQVVAVDPSSAALVRDDDVAYAGLAAATEGFAVRGGAGDDGDVDATMLARPVALDHVSVHGDGWAAAGLDDGQCRDQLTEGSSCIWWGEAPPHAGTLALDGFVWGHHITRPVVSDPAGGLAVARELAALRTAGDDQRAVDLAARAVDGEWSLFVRWGGPDGYADLQRTGFGLGGIGTSSRCGGVGDYLDPIWATHDLRAQLAPAVALCQLGGAHADITVETTREEISDVRVTISDAPSRGETGVLHDCLVEAVWATTLAIPDAHEHETTTTHF